MALAQRMLLYAHDELGMATMRLRLRFPGEQVKPHEELFKLHEEEVPARNVGPSPPPLPPIRPANPKLPSPPRSLCAL